LVRRYKTIVNATPRTIGFNRAEIEKRKNQGNKALDGDPGYQGKAVEFGPIWQEMVGPDFGGEPWRAGFAV